VNAASKGHLPVVRHLLSKQSADPLVRNNWGETAFDIAAAVFEIYICEVLQQAELEIFRRAGSATKYNPLAIHATVPIIVHEHQRLDTRFKTLAVNGGKPRFSVYHLGREGRRAPFELVLWPDGDALIGRGPPEKKYIPAWRNSVQLPFLDDSFTIPLPSSTEANLRDGAERSHFWMSDWMLDVTHPRVDVTDGWQYSRYLDDTEDRWTAETPPQLERLLTGSGLVAAGLGSPSTSSGSTRSNGQHVSKKGALQNTNLAWARRRRWVRVMRRRLDVTSLPLMQPDGNLYSLTEDGGFAPYVPDEISDLGDDEDGGVELSTLTSNGLSSHQDYISRARYLVGSSGSPSMDEMGPQTPADIKRDINKLSRAVGELRLGMRSDMDSGRKARAEALINTYNRILERIRRTANANGLYATNDEDDGEADADDNDSDDSFHYPQSPLGSSTTTRPASIRSHHTDYFSLARSSSRQPDLTPQLAQAPEFRVPTHDAPRKIATNGLNMPVPHTLHSQWERDEAAASCRVCKRRFTFLLRRHCRKCGRIHCNNCSIHRAMLDPSELITDPSSHEDPPGAPSLQRVCQACYDEVIANVPSPLRRGRSGGMESLQVSSSSLSLPGSSRRNDSSSQLSDLGECPVCTTNLADLGPASAQEDHVRTCLEGGSGHGTQQSGRYLVYKLPQESVLIGVECVICLEEFERGTLVARLSCLCTFHNHCLSAWLQRGRACPIHARDM
ncbi:uncharacterized protein EI90DRAFT_2905326, partial [Cantharellus anzutake]|uniref:uncharacterized protein n=1 Tax=Cantharellus anzutake TaxID=1750568 RepID=UPI001907CE16